MLDAENKPASARAFGYEAPSLLRAVAVERKEEGKGEGGKREKQGARRKELPTLRNQ